MSNEPIAHAPSAATTRDDDARQYLRSLLRQALVERFGADVDDQIDLVDDTVRRLGLQPTEDPFDDVYSILITAVVGRRERRAYRELRQDGRVRIDRLSAELANFRAWWATGPGHEAVALTIPPLVVASDDTVTRAVDALLKALHEAPRSQLADGHPQATRGYSIGRGQPRKREVDAAQRALRAAGVESREDRYLLLDAVGVIEPRGSGSVIARPRNRAARPKARKGTKRKASGERIARKIKTKRLRRGSKLRRK